MAKTLDFTAAFKYPFNRWKGLLNILWLLVPVYGWFLFIGYRVRIVAQFLEGKYGKTPTIEHGADFTLGWKMFWKAFPGMLVLVAGAILVGVFDHKDANQLLVFLYIAVVLLVVPVLSMHFVRKRTVASCFELDLVRVVFKNFTDYVIALLKDLALSLLFLAMWLILVGIPAGAYTKGIFLSEFYRKHVKK